MSVLWTAMASSKHPDRVAIECGKRAITYSELWQQAFLGSERLSEMGVGGGHRVVLEIGDRFAFALALHACLVHGALAVPVDRRLDEDERAARRAGATAVFTDWTMPDISEATWPRPLVQTEGGVATLMHTSGTTSHSRAVELTYDNWLHSSMASAVALGLDQEERWLCAMPLTHVGGLSILIRSSIYATTAVLHESFDTDAVLAELVDPARRITMVSLVPTMLTRLLDAGLERPPTLRWALLGGAPIPASLLERAAEAGVPVAPTYGMTEACSQIATFGRPVHGVELVLREDGEIVVRGPMIAPAELDETGWLHTGDLGRFDERGRLEIIGRKSDTIITGGENVAPQEVESVLQAHPAVAEAAVIGRPDPQWGEVLVALVVPRAGAELDPEELRAHCRDRLAGFKVPKAIEVVEGLPRTNSGKLLRRQIR